MTAITPAGAGAGVPRARIGRPPILRPGRPVCRHCGKKPVNRPRGLCWGCFYTPGVRERFPSASKHAVRGVGNGCFTPTVVPEPTGARPGTAEKLEVLAARAAAGVSLWHDLDGRV